MRMSCAISFFTEDAEIHYEVCPVHGTPVSSTRAELYGYLLVLSVVRDLEGILDITITLNLGCDNQRSLDVVNGEAPKKKNADFENEIHF